MKYIRLVFSINIITLFLNFKYFKFKDAIKLPIVIFGKVSVLALQGKIIINEPVKTGMIRIGQTQVGIFEKGIHTVLNLYGTLIFEGKANIGKGSSISIASDSTLKIGDNFIITGKSSIICSGGKSIIFGKNNLLSWDILVMNTDFHKIIDKTSKLVLNISKDIIIGNNVWIGCNTKVLNGSLIADNCVIGADSIVTKELNDSHSLYVGNPIRKIKENISWEI